MRSLGDARHHRGRRRTPAAARSSRPIDQAGEDARPCSPKEWKNGLTTGSGRRRAARRRRPTSSNAAQRLPWVQHHALGLPGGARGEEDVGEVVGRDRARRARADVRRGRRRRPTARKSSHAVVPSARRRRGARRSARAVPAGSAASAASRRSRLPRNPSTVNEQLGAGCLSSMSAASAPLNRVLSGTSTPPADWRPSGGDDPLADVGRPDRHPVAGLDAGGDQGPGDLLGLLGELAVGDVHGPRVVRGGGVVGDRVRVAVLFGRSPQRRRHRRRRRNLRAHVVGRCGSVGRARACAHSTIGF